MRRFSFRYLVIGFILLAISSCSQDNEKAITSFTETMLEGESGVVTIPTNTADWNISCIYNPDGMPIYDINGAPLHLRGLGQVSSSWFTIKRDSPTELKVIVKENFDAGTRGLIIEFTQGDITEDVTIRQKKSEGYTFSKIEYSLENGDGVTTYDKSYVHRFTLNNNTSLQQKMELKPFQDLKTETVFTSDDESAFDWTSDGEVDVKVPSSIKNEEIQFDTTLQKYSKKTILTDSKRVGEKVPVDVPAYTSTMAVVTGIKYCKMQATFSMTLVSRRTKAEKHITGKWIQEVAVDYNLKFDSKTLK